MFITKKGNRNYTIETSTKALSTPYFFPSISSVRTNYKIIEYLNMFQKSIYSGFLISAYDIFNDADSDNLIESISRMTDGKIFTMLDNGNYESYWKNDKGWGINNFESVLSKINVDFSFSFDVFYEEEKSLDENVKNTIRNTAITASFQRLGTTIPIIHSPLEKLPSAISEVVKGINPEIVGIAERELGPSLIQRAENLLKIRKRLDDTRSGIPIHLLGSGNPASILVYSLCGADIFDALEWCTTVVDPSSGILNHFIQRDLIKCKCEACNSTIESYTEKTILHNLIFYDAFMGEIRQALLQSDATTIVDKYLPKHFIPVLKGMCERNDFGLFSK